MRARLMRRAAEFRALGLIYEQLADECDSDDEYDARCLRWAQQAFDEIAVKYLDSARILTLIAEKEPA